MAVSENIKIPPFRRKPESLSPKANPPFALSRNEIPAFAGMALWGRAEIWRRTREKWEFLVDNLSTLRGKRI
ncbi:MAG: hypothetical protein ACR2QC_12595 [Gammaproteobacteria bacterium]